MKTDREKRGGKKNSYFLSFWFFLWMCVFVVCVCMQQQTIAPKSGLFRRPRPCVCVCERSLDPLPPPSPPIPTVTTEQCAKNKCPME
jgi:hypothetical protein